MLVRYRHPMRYLIFFGLWAAAGTIWWWRRVDARRRLTAIAEGRQCLSCDGTDVTREGDAVRCNVCGHQSPLSALANQVSDDEIAKLTKGD